MGLLERYIGGVSALLGTEVDSDDALMVGVELQVQVVLFLSCFHLYKDLDMV